MKLDPQAVFVPQCKVFIDGKQLKASSNMIESVSVQLTASEMANSCEISIFCEYSHKNSTAGSIIGTATAGKKVKVEMGYKLTKPVFMGYINSVGVDFSQDGVSMTISCLDARGLLMGNTSREGFENESVSQIVNKLLSPIKSFTDGVTVSVPGAADKEYPLNQHDMDDYSFICMLAKLSGCSFCMTGTKLMFVKNIYTTASMGESYDWGKNLLSFSRNVVLSGQLGKVRVLGTTPDTIEDFSADCTPLSGAGKSGASLCPPVKAKVLEKVCKTLKNQSEAKIYAEALMRESCLKLCTGQAQVVGNESLKPGTKIRFGGLDPKINGTYYVTSVTHRFSAGGFLTTVGFCSPTV